MNFHFLLLISTLIEQCGQHSVLENVNDFESFTNNSINWHNVSLSCFFSNSFCPKYCSTHRTASKWCKLVVEVFTRSDFWNLQKSSQPNVRRFWMCFVKTKKLPIFPVFFISLRKLRKTCKLSWILLIRYFHKKSIFTATKNIWRIRLGENVCLLVALTWFKCFWNRPSSSKALLFWKSLKSKKNQGFWLNLVKKICISLVWRAVSVNS